MTSDPYHDDQRAMGIFDCKCAMCMFLKEGGALPKKGANKKRFNEWLQQEGKCFYCEEQIPNWDGGVSEHIVPKSQGGKSTVFACKPCDGIKKNYATPEEFDAAIRRLKMIKEKVSKYEKG